MFLIVTIKNLKTHESKYSLWLAKSYRHELLNPSKKDIIKNILFFFEKWAIIPTLLTFFLLIFNFQDAMSSFFCLSYFIFPFVACGQSTNASFFFFSYCNFVLAWGQSGNIAFLLCWFSFVSPSMLHFRLDFLLVSFFLLRFFISNSLNVSILPLSFIFDFHFFFLFAWVNQ